MYYHDITKITIQFNYTSLYFFPIAYFENGGNPIVDLLFIIIIIIVYYYFVKILIENVCVCVWVCDKKNYNFKMRKN